MQASAAYERVVSSAAVRAVLELESSSGWVIAGGAALAIASGGAIASGDVDLFCIRRRGSLDPLRLAHALKAALESESATVDVRVSRMAYTLSTSSLQLQVILHQFSDFEHMFQQFDLPCCEFAYDPRAGYVMSSDRGMLALRTRTVDRAMIRVRNSEFLPARESKYASRGFRFEGACCLCTDMLSVLEAYYRSPVTRESLPPLPTEVGAGASASVQSSLSNDVESSSSRA